jgi:hypothetical protein
MKPKKYIQKELKNKTKEEIYSFLDFMLKRAWTKSDKVYYIECKRELRLQTDEI